MTPPAIPLPDPTPLPGPIWLFQALLLATFAVHLLLLNCTIGGTLIGAAHALITQHADAPGRQLGRWLSRLLPAAVTLTVTSGVAPLLFIQLLYGQVFFPATVLAGWVWLAVVPLIVMGYLAVYLYKHSWAVGGRTRWLSVTAVCFGLVLLIQSMANLLQLTPDRWVIVSERIAGLAQAPTLLPRLFHFLLASVAVAGMALAVVGSLRCRSHPDAFFAWMTLCGTRWAVVITGLQMVDGIWWLFALPRNAVTGLVGAGPGPLLLLGAGMGGGLLTLILLASLDRPEAQRGLLYLSAGSLLATVLLMVGIRDVLRSAYLAPFLAVSRLPIRMQTDLVLLFGFSFLLGALALGWLVRKLVQAEHA